MLIILIQDVNSFKHFQVSETTLLTARKLEVKIGNCLAFENGLRD